MAIQILNRAQAFGPGSELWVIPQAGELPILKKLDWYLNFQMARSHGHKGQELPPQIRSILNENQIPDFAPKTKAKSPLLIVAKEFVPTDLVMELPASENVKSWASQIHESWMNLNRPRLRVFLPTQISADDFKQHWAGPKSEEVTVVPN